MATELNPTEEEEFSPAIRAAFDSYGTPKPDAAFDARFWRELDARKNRYRGFWGFWRRLVEVEIEGVAVWRLAFSGVGGAAFCAVGFALLSWGASPVVAPQVAWSSIPRSASSTETPLNAPRFARDFGWWDELTPRRDAPALPPRRKNQSTQQEEFSCVSLAHGWA